MLIYSDDKKTVIEASCLRVERVVGGGKNGKYVISGWRNAIGEGVVCAQYATEEEAVNGLENAFKAIADGAGYYIF
ncbi:MAG: hypothetical protein NC203_06345 [Firmicutes bacterium]|nr:hypothetical protein [Bacillota bacterium]